MKSNIMVLGYFGYVSNQLDGQTIKTRTLYRLLHENSSNNIFYFDTQLFKFNKFKIFILFFKLIKINKLVYLPAHGNLKFLFPLIFLFSKIFRFDIHYFIIGGWLPEYIEKFSLHKYFLKKIKGIYSETQIMKLQLEILGLNNVTVFRNFRFIDHFKADYVDLNLDSNFNQITKFVFFSRIHKLKGLSSVFVLANYLLNSTYKDNVQIDFYGPINGEDESYFFKNINKFDFIEFKGKLEPEEICQVLSKYDCLLFPTKYYTEGLPGAIIDAYFAGIPVIASNWKHASEFIVDAKTGFIFDWDSDADFINKVITFIEDKNRILFLKRNASVEGNKYTDVQAWKCIKDIF